MPSSLSRLQELLPALFKTPDLPGKLYLRCQITPEITPLISMEYVQESLSISREEITSIPNISPYYMGLMTSRDHVFFAVDLPQLLGFSPLSIYSRDYHIIIINISTFLDQSFSLEREIFLGLAVNQIESMIRLTKEQILPTQNTFSGSIISYVSGVMRQEDTLIPLLDLNKIVKTLTTSFLG